MISVIIPIYNVEEWLWQCVESVLKQTYDDLEIILVDDGSTDNSPAICDKYVKEDSRIKVIHKKNGGLSDARNAGIEVSSGEYIFFLDGDDWLHKDALRILVAFAEAKHCDVVQCSHWYASKDALLFEYRHLSDSESPFVLNRERAMRQLIYNKYLKNFAWGKLYRTLIIKKHLFPFDKYFEDSYWQHLIIHDSKNVGIIPQPYYFYRQRNDSISGVVSFKNLDMIRGMYERLVFINDHYKELSPLAYRKFWKAVWLLSVGITHSNEQDILNVALNDIKNDVNNDARICKSWPRWFNYRYVCCNYLTRLIPAFNLCERLYGFIFVKNMRIDCAEYESLEEISHILLKRGIYNKINKISQNDILITTNVNCNMVDLLCARRIEDSEQNKYVVKLNGCDLFINVNVDETADI